jgi:hypothetical protein
MPGPPHLLRDEPDDVAEGVGGLLRREVLGRRRRRHAERLEPLDQVRDRLRMGTLVHAVERRPLRICGRRRHLVVGQHHELLDRRVRLGLLASLSAPGTSEHACGSIGSTAPGT